MKVHFEELDQADDRAIARIIRDNLENYHLDIPGTAYYDPELDHLSTYYRKDNGKRAYFILKDEDGKKVRNDRDIKRDYIRGRYGAIPFIGK